MHILSHDHAVYRRTITLAAILLALAVILGAFGAHALRAKLSAHQLNIFDTGIRYHFIHAIGMLGVVGLHNFIRPKQIKTISILILIGIIFFSGSLYLLATRELLGIAHWKFLGPMTPIGGMFFIMAWGYLAYASLQNKQT